jgi:hypothetical protein
MSVLLRSATTNIGSKGLQQPYCALETNHAHNTIGTTQSSTEIVFGRKPSSIDIIRRVGTNEITSHALKPILSYEVPVQFASQLHPIAPPRRHHQVVAAIFLPHTRSLSSVFGSFALPLTIRTRSAASTTLAPPSFSSSVGASAYCGRDATDFPEIRYVAMYYHHFGLSKFRSRKS